jgi:hypothetical protein
MSIWGQSCKGGGDEGGMSMIMIADAVWIYTNDG